MKKHILFVDDEPMVLEGLRRMLRSMREEWEMEFVDGGEKALDRMTEQAFDVVVADMRMPGMNGAVLLNEVMKRYPNTVRLILSGHADKDLILQCVGSTHQYLAKPCDAVALKATVVRASRMGNLLESEQLKQLVGRMTSLPSIPTLYTQIVEKANQPDASLEDVAEIVSQDPGMTVKILKLVNSAYFGIRRELSNPKEAVAYIGLDTIKSLVLSLHAFSQFENVNVDGLTMESLWTHSLDVAAWAKHIAKCEGCDRRMVDEAFTAGMLHDVGKLVLAANMPADFGRAVRLANEQKVEFRIAEDQVFGASHAEVGGYLLGLWGLPVPVVEAIALHHCPEKAEHDELAPLAIVHVADVLASQRGTSARVGAAPTVNADYLTKLGLAERIQGWSDSMEKN